MGVQILLHLPEELATELRVHKFFYPNDLITRIIEHQKECVLVLVGQERCIPAAARVDHCHVLVWIVDNLVYRHLDHTSAKARARFLSMTMAYLEVLHQRFHVSKEQLVLRIRPWWPVHRHWENRMNAVIRAGPEKTLGCPLIVAVDKLLRRRDLFLGQRHVDDV